MFYNFNFALFISEGCVIMSKNSVAGIAVKDGKVLIAHRLPIGAMGNRWEFPGGKVEKGEDFSETLKREFLEEFGVKIDVGNLITQNYFFHNDKKINLYAYEIKLLDSEENFVFTEHSEATWVYFDEIKKLNFVDSDLKIYEDIRKYFNC